MWIIFLDRNSQPPFTVPSANSPVESSAFHARATLKSRPLSRVPLRAPVTEARHVPMNIAARYLSPSLAGLLQRNGAVLLATVNGIRQLFIVLSVVKGSVLPSTRATRATTQCVPLRHSVSKFPCPYTACGTTGNQGMPSLPCFGYES